MAAKLREKLQKILDGKPGRFFTRDNLILLVLGGMLLFCIAVPTGGKKKESAAETDIRGSGQSAGLAGETGGAQVWGAGGEGAGTGEGDGIFVGEADLDDYAEQLERRLESLLGRMEGVGRVQVMVTLSSSSELVVEKDRPATRNSTTEQDSQGGVRSVEAAEVRESTVYATRNGAGDPFVVKTLPPGISGVVVVAEGAGRGRTNADITRVVQALFGLEAHRIQVVGMGETK